MAKALRHPARETLDTPADLRIKLVGPKDKARWNKLVRQHHYLKNATLVGEQLRYVVSNAQDQWLALLGWSAPALHLKARDQSIEWSDRQREARLHLLAQNSRFVILPAGGDRPNLASQAMRLCLERLSTDWQAAYQHPIVMVESFVDRQLFRATAYKACGWEALGYSSGFKRVAEDFYERHDRPKELWVKVLDRRAWNWLRAAELPPHLAPFEKVIPPECRTPTDQMPSLRERFAVIPDWRKPNGRRHKLPTVLAITALAAMAGVGQGYRAVSRFAERLTRLQRKQLKCWIHPDTGESHAPSETVFQRVLQEVDRHAVERITVQWQKDVLGPTPVDEAIVIDGKEVRAGGLMLVNAVAQPSQRLEGVEPVDAKTNEIPTARTLIQRLELTGRLTQLDGMQTQHATAHQLLYERGSDYSLIVRENQPTLLATVQTLLPEGLPPSTGPERPTRWPAGVPGDCDADD